MPEHTNNFQVFRELLDLLPVGAAIAEDREAAEITLNPAGARMLGRQLRSDEFPLKQVIQSGDAIRDATVSLARADGSILRAQVSVIPLRNEKGEIVAAAGIFFDPASDPGARAEQFRELALALADAEARERKRLARLLHDDFQQLISAAKLRAGILRRMAREDDIRSGATQVEQLLETAIAASRSLTNELNPPVLYDAGLIPAIEAMSRSLQEQYSLRITTRCDPRSEPEAERISVLLFEAVRELLHNVVQHAGASNVQVTMSLAPEEKIKIEVRDDGKGFEPSRLNVSQDRQTRPFGLIEISERLRWLGGALQIESRLGEGTTVTVLLPAVVRAIPEVSAEKSRVEPSPATPERKIEFDSRRRARILVADDHALFREGLIGLLRHEPLFEVVGEAADGEEAVSMARSLKPDILLVDVTMPKINGLEVTSRLSQEDPNLRIVGLSMHDRRDMAAAMRNAGATAYLTKGGSSEALLRVLRSLVMKEA